MVTKRLRIITASATIIFAAVILAVGVKLIKSNKLTKEINQNIIQGTVNLNSGKISEAKENFEKAIELQKGKMETYITINNEYVKAGRLDDALAILKEGKNNNVTGLESLIQEIKLKFQTVSLEESAYQNETYALPEKVMIKINNEDLSVPVRWNVTKAETNKLGDFVFDGAAQDYERPVKMTLHVISRPVIKNKQIGYISKVFEEQGKKYLKFDDVKFLLGEEAVKAAKKDGKAYYENGRYFVYDDYYIVNDSQVKKKYVISDSASLNILGIFAGSNSYSIENKPVSYNKFKAAVNLHSNMLCYIYTENDVIIKVEGQYIP
ncbi:MAG: Ig-like domain-containing protein [Bacillota bacterium]|nr:Ig-like domain-containing protein [Bacillota bacterium]